MGFMARRGEQGFGCIGFFHDSLLWVKKLLAIGFWLSVPVASLVALMFANS